MQHFFAKDIAWESGAGFGHTVRQYEHAKHRKRCEQAMTLKQGIVAELGGTDLLVPDLIARSLQANDQIKYYFALLQTARSNADQPRIPAPDLRTERVASKVADTSLDNVIATTKRDLKHGYSILHAVEIFERIKACMADMLACLPAVERGAFENRVQKLKPPI